MIPGTDDFRSELSRRLADAQTAGKPYLDVLAGDLHAAMNAGTGNDARYPSCCGVMRQEWQPGDEILSERLSDTPTLSIRYKLPRTGAA